MQRVALFTEFGRMTEPFGELAYRGWTRPVARGEREDMTEVKHTSRDMIAGMTPELRDAEFVFVSTTDADLIVALTPQAISVFHEDEGTSLIVPVDVAAAYALPLDSPMRCITLNVYSSLEGVGLTAAVAQALADHGIACNMVAATHHDHAFVPAGLAGQAFDILKDLQTRAEMT